MVNFSWKYSVPQKGWWDNYRWHITEPSEKLGLKSEGWKKSFFRSGWQNKVLEIENIEGAKNCLSALQNGTLTAFGGRFRGASYDKNCKLLVKQTKRELKKAIKNHNQGKSIIFQETAIVPNSYYNWGKIIVVSGGVILVPLLFLCFFVFRKKSCKLK